MIARGYELDHAIGRGSMGLVYRATRRMPPGGVVAIKRVPVAADPELRQHLRAEAEILASLDHPHIMRVLELMDDDDGVAIVMPFAVGGSLADLLLQQGRLTPSAVVEIAVPTAEALSSAHGHGVLHCDVKPSNIVFTSDGEPLLTDFGLARWVARPSIWGQAVLGTAEYLDPEVAEGATPDERSDVYSLAVVCYECLTGRVPFTGPTPLAVLRSSSRGRATPVVDLVSDIPRSVSDLVAAGMARRRSRRPATAREFADELLRGWNSADPDVSSSPAHGPPTRAPVHRDSHAAWRRPVPIGHTPPEMVPETNHDDAGPVPAGQGGGPPTTRFGLLPLGGTPPSHSSSAGLPTSSRSTLSPAPGPAASSGTWRAPSRAQTAVLGIAMVSILAGLCLAGLCLAGLGLAGVGLARASPAGVGLTGPGLVRHGLGLLVTDHHRAGADHREAGSAAGRRPTSSNAGSCPPVPTGADDSTVVIGDVRGDGCEVPVTWRSNIASVVLDRDGPIVRFDLGRPGDQLLLGDWTCRGRAVPALYRPQTGDVFLFSDWAPPGPSLPGTLERHTGVIDGIAVVSPGRAGQCDQVDVRPATMRYPANVR